MAESGNREVAVVTGVGPGTGAAIARRFALGGYCVAMLARNRERLSELERQTAGTRGYPCDVTDEAQIDSALAAIRSDLGVPSVLIHNAVGGQRRIDLSLVRDIARVTASAGGLPLEFG